MLKASHTTMLLVKELALCSVVEEISVSLVSNPTKSIKAS